MHDKLKCIEIDMQEAPAHTYTDEQWDEVQERISEVEELMEKAYCVGALVDWPTLKRIREIKEETAVDEIQRLHGTGSIGERCSNGI